MRKFYFLAVLLMSISSGLLFGQDIIVLKSGDEVKSKVLEINDKEVKYKKFDNLDGPTFSTLKSEVFMIKYQNGTKDVFSSTGPAKSGETAKLEQYIDNKPNRVGFYLNPLGFIQFGPMLGTEITINSRLIIDGHLRFSPAGLLMYAITKSDDGISPYKISGLGVGGGLKFLHPSRIGGFYSGFLLEYGWQTQYYEKNEPWVWQEESKYIVTAANVGYKFRFSSGFYINTGAILGTAFVTKDIWYYTKNYNGDSSIHNSGANLKPFGMLELAFGVEF